MSCSLRAGQALAVAGISVLSFAACADGERPDAEPSAAASVPAARGGVDVSVLRRNREGRILSAGSPEEVADAVSTVVQGTIAGWADGPMVVNYDERDYSAVLKIKVAHDFKSAKRAGDGYVYVYFPRGGEVLDANGEPFRNPGAESTVTSVDDLNKAAPVGTRVLFLGGGPIAVGEGLEDKQVRVENAGAGLPDGAPLLRAHAQGLLLDDGGRLASAAGSGEPWDWFPGADKASDQFARLVSRLSLKFPGTQSRP